MRVPPAFVLSSLLLLSLVAGCAESPPPVDAAPPEQVPAPPAARVVVADIDTGINPYHAEFRDTSPEAYRHPSEYLPGFPPEAKALEITFGAEDYEAAVLADCEVWLSVEPETLYWFPGTRIVGAYTTGDLEGMECSKDSLPYGILDQSGHGTMTASRIAGSSSSLCPECKIVFLQGFSSANMLWAASQPFIDVQTNSWGDLPTGYACGGTECPVPLGNDRDEVVDAASRHAVFVAGGNGLAGFYGVTGHPAYLDNVAGPAGIIMVGGHDGGQYTPWTMTLPHIVADAMMHPAARSDHLTESPEDEGGGTSGATPFAAGTFARMVLEARKAVGDEGTGVRGGDIVVAGPGAELPADGPLADGRLTLEEAKATYFHTANPRPVRDGRWDGPSCDATCPLYPTLPVDWDLMPGGLPLYYFVGYGQVGNVTLQAHVDAVLGRIPVPERPIEDQQFGLDQSARRAADDNAP